MVVQQDDAGIRERLKAIVGELGGITAAAEKAQVSREALWKWLEGKARLPLFPVAVLYRASGHSLGWLVTGNSPVPPPPPLFPPEFIVVPPLTMADLFPKERSR